MTTQTEPRQEAAPKPPRKKHHVFLWIFGAVQVVFIVWLITGIVRVSNSPDFAQQAAQYCAKSWHSLFSSYAQCVTETEKTSRAAYNVGGGIGASLVVILWVVVDLLLAIPYGIYKLATRKG